ncbi:MAG: DUF1501 domain-containing protein [Candidatus Omnitrophota bacterium]|jgi:uncharacterized protein (DUF1501 family)|nr:MAG: DUF1501 domain-containing protein [Candidatus Omnitrophota bacterium]
MDQNPPSNLNRREFFLAGGFGGACFMRPFSKFSFFRDAKPARACVLIWLDGGLSQLDTFDPKPYAPYNIRGPFKTLPTCAPAVLVCEHLPRIAEMMEHVTLIRSICSNETNHDRASYQMQTGCTPPSAFQPARLGDFFNEKPQTGPIFPAQITIHSKPDCISNHYTQKLFDFRMEGNKFLKMYGQTTLGKNCLIARRCVEAEIRFITVVDQGWDQHDNIHMHLQNDKLPALDQAYSALIQDLLVRDLLDETLVVLMSEFGRSPVINQYNGRDHWPHASSVLLAGGPVARGKVIGETDETGANVIQSPITPAELVSAIYTANGILIDENRNEANLSELLAARIHSEFFA